MSSGKEVKVGGMRASSEHAEGQCDPKRRKENVMERLEKLDHGYWEMKFEEWLKKDIAAMTKRLIELQEEQSKNRRESNALP